MPKSKKSKQVRYNQAKNEWTTKVEGGKNYSRQEAAVIMGVQTYSVTCLVENGKLTGPNSEPELPVDHDSLIKYIDAKQVKAVRSRLRRLAMGIVAERFKLLGVEFP